MSRKTYINPRYSTISRNIHVNPNFNRPCNVHINPRIVNMGQINVPETPMPTPSTSYQAAKYSWKRKTSPTAQHKKTARSEFHLSPTKRKLVRKDIKVGIKLCNKVWDHQKSSKYLINKNTKFKIDKRASNAKKNKVGFKLETLFPRNLFRYNKYNILSKRILQPKNKRPAPSTSDSSNKKLINIGGISYKVTSKKMTRTSPIKKENSKKFSDKAIINIQGDKYMLSANGAKLRRLSTSTIRPRARLDFGGVTYRQQTDGVLVRTNSHTTRHVLMQARQRSIAVLAARRRKINTPCLVFRKFGRCQRNEQNECIYIHDKKNIDLCKRFLRRECNDKNCLLSHDVVHQKVATCQYYLEGTCVRDDCPYLHVKVSAKAEICAAFLQGYCPSGDECSKRHMNICPVFDKIGICKRGKKCPYPHPKRKKKPGLNSNKFKFNVKSKRKSGGSQKKAKKKETEVVGDNSQRYYATDSVPEPSNQNLNVVPTREQLDTLPTFISLSET